ncbi:MAG: polysaccharide biosynthesis protein [Myxococcales bacterium]|nr:polysaccharide biosynthesis protein [Myxococcales bacterium]
MSQPDATPADAPGEKPPNEPNEPNLRARMLRSSVFELGGYGAQQVLRLVSNLILTRLLFPAAFGLVSIVNVLLTGLVLLSDLAIQPCVIQSKRGDEPAFLNTAFTIQVIRGSALTVVMLLIAKPAAWFYREPQLESLIYFGSLQLLLQGFHSTSIFTLRRALRVGWINALELGQSVVGLTVMITLARRGWGVWSLIIGMVLGTFLFSSISHILPVPYRNRFHIDKEASKEISHFGRWVLGSSAAQFLGAQSDRLLMGRLLNATWLGVYTVAGTLSEAASAVINRLVNGVMYPVLSQAARSPDGKLPELYYRLRLRLDAVSMSGTGLLAGAGGWIVHVLWDKRYTDAAWILRILCFRVAVSLIVGPSETCLFSLGHTRYGFKRSVVRLVAAAVCIPLGWYLGGVRGLVWGTVATEASTVFVIWPKLRELGILRYRRELLSIGIFTAAFALGAAVMPWLPQLHVR